MSWPEWLRHELNGVDTVMIAFLINAGLWALIIWGVSRLVLLAQSWFVWGLLVRIVEGIGQ